MLKNRKKRPLDRIKSAVRDAKLVVIATEGSVTERIYFDQFGNSRIQVKVIPSVGGNSSPEHVFNNISAYKEEYQIGTGDELWLAIDVDRWPKAKISDIAARCKAIKVGLAISNPCFEFWLALHIDTALPESITSETLESHLRKGMGSFQK